MRATRCMGVVETGEMSVSTSADSSNFLVANGRRYGHILDPRTLQPSTESLSATVLSRDGTLADAMSKAAFILGPRLAWRSSIRCPACRRSSPIGSATASVGVAVSARLAGSYHPTPR